MKTTGLVLLACHQTLTEQLQKEERKGKGKTSSDEEAFRHLLSFLLHSSETANLVGHV
jgi:hypothetical protein